MTTLQATTTLQRPDRREFLRTTGCLAAVASGLAASANANENKRPVLTLGENKITILSDGVMHLPVPMILPDNLINPTERDDYLQSKQLSAKQLSQDCNITLVKQQDKTIIFDVGAGPNFMPDTGKLFEELEAKGIDSQEVTDVVFTHAHPDHLWGLLDDFDEPLFPNAQYHMHKNEWEYWLNDNTLSNTPDNRKAFVVGTTTRRKFKLI